MTRAASQCDQCGQVDNHPKAHWDTGKTYHHDCLPFDLKQQLLADAPQVESIISAAESGTRGDDLLAHIKNLHEEN